jgi:nitrogen fixation NifU-like protein
MSDLLELYQEMILDHGRRPRFCYEPLQYTWEQEGFNPLCGDKVHLYAVVDGDVLKEVSFKGQGCAISMASTSLMLQTLQGVSVAKARALMKNVHDMLVFSKEFDTQYAALLEKIQVLKGVKNYPGRIKCATLAWHTLEALLNLIEPDHV